MFFADFLCLCHTLGGQAVSTKPAWCEILWMLLLSMPGVPGSAMQCDELMFIVQCVCHEHMNHDAVAVMSSALWVLELG